MATDERFLEIPYGGVNPSTTTVSQIGILAGNPGDSMKMCCGLASGTTNPSAVYCFRVGGNNYAVTTGASTNMVLFSSYNSSSSYQSRVNIAAYVGSARVNYGNVSYYTKPQELANYTSFSTRDEALEAFVAMIPDEYVNIQYIGNGCSLNGPSYVDAGTGIVVPVTLPIGATLTAANISVTKGGSSIDFNYNPQTLQIAFTAI